MENVWKQASVIPLYPRLLAQTFYLLLTSTFTDITRNFRLSLIG